MERYVSCATEPHAAADRTNSSRLSKSPQHGCLQPHQLDCCAVEQQSCLEWHGLLLQLVSAAHVHILACGCRSNWACGCRSNWVHTLTALCYPVLGCAVCSTYSKVFASVDDRLIQFRQDGLPISAQKVPGKPLMAPKPPSPAELTVSKRLCAKYNHSTSVCIGVPGRKDPRHFNSVYSLVHTAPHRSGGMKD